MATDKERGNSGGGRRAINLAGKKILDFEMVYPFWSFPVHGGGAVDTRNIWILNRGVPVGENRREYTVVVVVSGVCRRSLNQKSLCSFPSSLLLLLCCT